MADGIVVTRTFTTPRDRVFDAWTTPEQFSVWFGTSSTDIPIESVEMDVRVGGAWKADMHLPEGHVIRWVGEYVVVDRPGRLVFTITDNPDDPAREPVSVLFEDIDGTTVMTMSQTGAGFSEAQLEQTVIGYNAFFDDLEKLL
jgi:uncharacterized protein YndB with AHSA1/START domain